MFYVFHSFHFLLSVHRSELEQLALEKQHLEETVKSLRARCSEMEEQCVQHGRVHQRMKNRCATFTLKALSVSHTDGVFLGPDGSVCQQALDVHVWIILQSSLFIKWTRSQSGLVQVLESISSHNMSLLNPAAGGTVSDRKGIGDIVWPKYIATSHKLNFTKLISCNEISDNYLLI